MHALHNETNNRHYYMPIITAIQRTTREVTSEYDFLVPRGWQMITKMKSGGETFLHLHLIEGKGGSYAEAKMATLENFPQMPYTGADGCGDLLDMLDQLNKNDPTVIAAISSVENPDQLTKAQKEWLRDECKIASMYGGIRMPYEFLINTDKESHTNEGEILIAFSGASQEQDAFFALWIFKAIQKALAKYQNNIQHSYDLSALRQNPVIHHWMKILHIHDYDR